MPPATSTGPQRGAKRRTQRMAVSYTHLNPNEVVLTWKRTNTGYFDTLQDCCHVYTYGVDVLKQFSDGKGDLTNVSFRCV